MKYGKQLQVLASGDPWAEYYVDYKGLKKIINSLAKGRPLDAAALAAVRRRAAAANQSMNGFETHTQQILPASTESDLMQTHKAAFFFQLDRELEKINAFYLNKEAELNVRLRTLIDKRKIVQTTSAGRLARDSSSFVALSEGFRLFQRDLAKLEKFIEVNATAFRKILKKWDKRSRSNSKELYLSRQIEVTPCFDRTLIGQLHDAVTANMAKLDLLVATADPDAFPEADRLPARTEADSVALSPNTAEAIDDLEYALNQAIQRQDIDSPDALLARWSASVPSSSPLSLRRQRILWHAAIAWPRAIPTALFEQLDFSFADDINGRSCLHEAAAAGRNDLVQAILLQGSTSAQQTDFYGRQPIHYAAMRGFDQVVLSLLKVEPTLNTVDFEGQTPVTYAIIHGHVTCLQLCMQFGYRPSAPASRSIQKPVLALACEHGRAEIVQLLLDSGADICADSAGFYPQHLAAREGFDDCLRLLIARPECKIDQVDKFSIWTALFHAAAGGRASTVKLLLDAGASAFATDENSRVAAHYAAWQGHIDALNLLLAAHNRHPRVEHPEKQPNSGDTQSTNEMAEDEAGDLIPSFSLPPPIIPFRVYGHNYLDRKGLMQITLGRPNTVRVPSKSPIKLYFTEHSQITSFRMVITCKSDVSAMPHNIIIPMDDDERTVFPFQVDSLADFSVQFDLYPTFGSQIIGRAFALPSLFTGTSNLQSHTIPLTDAQSKLIGELYFEANAIHPFAAVRLAPGKQLETYWKASQQRSQSHATPAVVTGSSLSGEYVQVVVQLSRDLIPVAFPHWTFDVDGLDLQVSDYKLEQLIAIATKADRVLTTKRSQTLKSSRDWHSAISQCIIPLDVLLKILPSTLGINIEIRHPTASDVVRLSKREAADVNAVVDSVLSTVYAGYQDEQSGPTASRRIVFSSFNPVVCTALNWKQPNYAVLFASYCGLSRSSPVGVMLPANRVEVDRRCTSIREAAKFAKANNLLGLMLDATILVQVPSLITAIKEYGVQLVTMGEESREALKLGGDDAHLEDGILTYATDNFPDVAAV